MAIDMPQGALPPRHQAVVDRFVAACQADERWWRLAQTHGLTYPTDLDRMMYGRLERLRDDIAAATVTA
jgi:hypothetical protein